MNMRRMRQRLAIWAALVMPWLVACAPADAPQSSELADAQESEAHVAGHRLGMVAHHLCAGMYVVGRDYERTPDRVVLEDIQPFPLFQWQDDYEYEVDAATRTASVLGPDGVRRSARYHGDQGCTILPEPSGDIQFEPHPVPRTVPNPDATSWPTGDLDAYHDPPPQDIDMPTLEAALDWTMAQTEHNTRALVVVYEGKLLGERYAAGFSRHTPQISWSQGKSVAAALLGAAIQRGDVSVGLDDPAPIPEWRQDPDDMRQSIRVRDLLNMSSGLDFLNLGLNQEASWTHANEHFHIYFESIDVLAHAADQPMDREPGEVFRYRNSDPLNVLRIVRDAADAAGEEWLTYPQRVLFDRIGARNFVLETDPWGNFIITGYDFGSAWDWARFGLLHLWDGQWPAEDGSLERILPEGWVDFVSSPAPGAQMDNYGGLFWLNRGGSLPDAPEDAYWAAGFMGQFTVIVPSHDMVIVRLGPSAGNTNAYLNEIVSRVTAAVSNDGPEY